MNDFPTPNDAEVINRLTEMVGVQTLAILRLESTLVQTRNLLAKERAELAELTATIESLDERSWGE